PRSPDVLLRRRCFGAQQGARTVSAAGPAHRRAVAGRPGICPRRRGGRRTIHAGRPDSRAGLEMAGVADAVTILALSHNDQLNLQAALRARDANPHIRIVLRQFNRTLAAKIEQNLSDCSVLSLAWHSAATYAAAALDPSCFRGLQFPEPTGPLSGFAIRTAAD